MIEIILFILLFLLAIAFVGLMVFYYRLQEDSRSYLKEIDNVREDAKKNEFHLQEDIDALVEKVREVTKERDNAISNIEMVLEAGPEVEAVEGSHSKKAAKKP